MFTPNFSLSAVPSSVYGLLAAGGILFVLGFGAPASLLGRLPAPGHGAAVSMYGRA